LQLHENIFLDQGVAHARYVLLIEFSEESGSPDLPIYLEQLAPRLGQVSDHTACESFPSPV
jgi:acetylornithine deacetylase/succinyl-diaminopimelate desuccinylase-like protein